MNFHKDFIFRNDTKLVKIVLTSVSNLWLSDLKS